EKEARLAWFISYNSPGELSLTPKIQKALPDKSWSQGRNLALGRVFAGEHFHFFTLQDHQIFQSLLRQTDDKGETFAFEQSRAIPALAGHPYLFINGRDQIPASLQAGQTRIMVDKSAADGEISLQIYPEFNGRDFMVVEESPARFTFYRNNHQLEEIARLLGRDGSAMPPEAEPEIPDILEALLPLLPVHSNLPLTPEGSAPAVSETQLFLQIFPAGDGLRFELTSKPLGPQGPQLRPGEGKKYLYAKIDEKTCAVNRDLELENERRRILLEACPGLGEDNAQACWQITEIERCLQILHEIRMLQKRLPDEAPWLICEWPAGRKLGLKEKPGPSALRFRIKPHQEWFKIEGELQIDEKETLNLRELLQSMKKKHGQFLPLADNHFITLTEDLQRRMQELSFYLNHEGGELLIHKASTAKVAEILGDLPKVETSHSWHEQLQRFKEAESFKPEIPSTLQAELRSYQKEGFSWLARLAHLGFGACLADDMGLGKTVQTLTLILSRAARGPALVVAPTSVCANWHKECERFAPILNPIQFGGNDRQELLDKIKPYDLLICSYTMLQQEKKMFAAREWEIIVLDEAQAIKNLNTKRSQAAMSLRGRFRLTTTGTPIENHLGELWNLFQFINPGLLGSLDQFNQRFAIPIEQENNTEARLLLQKIIQPYILRRHKNQVLRELPPRTEIVLQVEMSEAELNFYEAVRRQAIDRLEEAGNEENQNRGGTSIQVLAELTRLRLAACNPRLVLPESTIESAKLKHCGRIIDDLLAGGHQALIFSQFVKHLELVRAYLDKKKIAYRYLDGSTPKARRQAEISAFQEGQANLFLISLKAGGLGLNLTAADYVLHLDPWWNPAIEDQASDRAHRIGQNRPVTVYRLISRDTIEEKIVRLHQEKRNLADQILSASDQSARFTTGELLKLIKEG
ncbi:MAG: DEAD/DEAH box helicase, partial [Deltaproteobacteria bacterium]|nr:DEAD/DEAH box helicase [Deltaproteobacteria bacterium]